MKLKEIYEKIDARFPKKLSDEYIASYGGHDNSGILLDGGKEIAGAVFSLDLSQGALDAALENGYNLIVTHHPAIFYPVSGLRADDPLGARILRAAENGIGIISMHLNLDCAEGGIDESLARAAGGKGELAPQEKLVKGGYGRIYDVDETAFSVFVQHLKDALCTERAFVYGEERMITRAASFCGAGVDAGAIASAKRAGAQVIVSADIKHNFICDAMESGLNVVQLTHYASENYGFKKIYQELKDKLGVPCVFYEDRFML